MTSMRFFTVRRHPMKPFREHEQQQTLPRFAISPFICP
jgi:hypothetical protein